jgi:hypothetical protein
MIADPNPRDCVAFQNADGSVALGNAHRSQYWIVGQPMEMQAWMLRIMRELPVRFARRFANGRPQLPIPLPKDRQGLRVHS